MLLKQIESYNSIEVIHLLLLLAGDIETNPGPFDVPELNLTNLSRELNTLTSPVEFGIALGIPQHELDIIKRNNPHDIKEQKIALFMYIAVNSRRLLITWSSIADALNNFQGNLSEHIKGKFCAQPNDRATPQTTETVTFGASNAATGISGVYQAEPNSSSGRPLSAVQDQQSHLILLPGFKGDKHTPCSPAAVAEPPSPGFKCPYCGICSIDKFFSNAGCPKSSRDQQRFPYLDISQLEHVKKEYLEERLAYDTYQMVLHFDRLTLSTRKSIETQGILTRELARCMLSFKAFSSNHSASQTPLLEEHKTDILSSDSIVQTFWIIREYISFFNYEIIKLIIEDLGTGEDRMKLKEYEAAFSEFCQRNVFEIPPHVYGQALTHGKKQNVIVFKYTPNVASTLQAVRWTRFEISKILGIQAYSLQLCSVEKGCLELHFLMPAFMTEHVLASSASHSKALLDIGVRLLTSTPLPLKEEPSEAKPEAPSVKIEGGSSQRPQESSTPSNDAKEKFDKLEVQLHALRDATLVYLSKKSGEKEGLFRLVRTRLALLPGSLPKQRNRVRYFSAVNIARILLSKSFEEIFALLDDYWSVLNCSLLLHIIMKFTDDSVQTEAESFRSSLKVFRTSTSLSQLKGISGGVHINPEFTRITTLSQQPKLEMYTLESVETLKETLALKAFLQPFATQFVSASPGNVVLTWALPKHLAPLLVDSLDHYFLQRQSIDAVKVGGVSLRDFRKQNSLTNIEIEDSADFSRNFLSVCASGNVESLVNVCLQYLQLEKDSAEMVRVTALEFLSEEFLTFASFLVGVSTVDLETSDPKSGKTALLKAVENGMSDVVKVLIDAGASLEAKDTSGKTALLKAVENGMSDVVKVLIDAGASLEAKDTSGKTALLKAVENGMSDVVKVLIDAGASLEAKDTSGKTALLKAVENGMSDVVKVLIDAGASLEAKDTSGKTALLKAAENGMFDVVEILIDAGASLEAKDTLGSTALLLAAVKGRCGIVMLLAVAGASPEAKDNSGRTALLHAAENGSSSVVKSLVYVGAILEAIDKNGRTALLLAADHGNAEVVKILVESGANPDATDIDGITALMLAVASEDSPDVIRHSSTAAMVKTLIDAKANLDAKDKYGHTALDFAIEYECDDGVILWLRTGATRSKLTRVKKQPYSEYATRYRSFSDPGISSSLESAHVNKTNSLTDIPSLMSAKRYIPEDSVTKSSSKEKSELPSSVESKLSKFGVISKPSYVQKIEVPGSKLSELGISFKPSSGQESESKPPKVSISSKPSYGQESEVQSWLKSQMTQLNIASGEGSSTSSSGKMKPYQRERTSGEETATTRLV